MAKTELSNTVKTNLISTYELSEKNILSAISYENFSKQIKANQEIFLNRKV
jgi:hypothetical protein